MSDLKNASLFIDDNGQSKRLLLSSDTVEAIIDDDSEPTKNKTWSSSKIQTEFLSVNNAISSINNIFVPATFILKPGETTRVRTKADSTIYAHRIQGTTNETIEIHYPGIEARTAEREYKESYVNSSNVIYNKDGVPISCIYFPITEDLDEDQYFHISFSFSRLQFVPGVLKVGAIATVDGKRTLLKTAIVSPDGFVKMRVRQGEYKYESVIVYRTGDQKDFSFIQQNMSQYHMFVEKYEDLNNAPKVISFLSDEELPLNGQNDTYTFVLNGTTISAIGSSPGIVDISVQDSGNNNTSVQITCTRLLSEVLQDLNDAIVTNQ